jgi:hypothetical protein
MRVTSPRGSRYGAIASTNATIRVFANAGFFDHRGKRNVAAR